MRPQNDPRRRCLPVTDWPDADRRAWETALASAHPLSERRSSAADWVSATTHKNRRGYGRWLTFLRGIGADLSGPLADRVTSYRVQMYLQELKAQGVAPYTLRNRALELLAVMLAVAPDRDWKWLRACVIALEQAAAEAADHSLPPLLVADIIERAHRELTGRALPPRSRNEAVEWRDWFMVAFLCLLPLRLKNFTALQLGAHLSKVGGFWRLDVPATEIKTRRPYSAFIPDELVPWLEQYLKHVRPRLEDEPSAALWLNRSGRPLAEHTIYLRITRLMARAFGASVHPHAFRQIFATSVSMSDARSMDGARAALGHSTDLTTQHHYNRSTAVMASRRHAALILRLRRATT